MKLRELYEGIRFGPQLFDQVLADSLLRVGFEIEFVWPIERVTSLPDWDKTKLKIIQQLNQLGIPISSTVGSTNVHWQLVGDRSINTNNEGFGYELIAPPMEMATALSTLKLIFDWMIEKGCMTNETTGLHINISRGGTKATREIDPLKVVLLLGERYLLDAFDRQGNKFTEPQIQSMIKSISWAIKTQQPAAWLDNSNAQELIDLAREELSVAKFSTVNIAKLSASARNAYFEFRIMGNKDYHKKFELVKKTILRYGFLLQIAADPKAYRREYLQELGRLIVQALSQSAPNEPLRDPSKITSLTTRNPERLIKMDPIVRYASAPFGYRQDLVSKLSTIQQEMQSSDPKERTIALMGLGQYLYLLTSVEHDDKTALAAALALKTLLRKGGYSVQDAVDWYAKNNYYDTITRQRIKNYLSRAK